MNSLIEFLMKRISQLGEAPLCNGVASRAPHIFGYCFPLCYRCLFIFIGLSITLWLCYKYKKRLPIYLIIILLLPMIVDGSLQTFLGLMSTNFRRSLTGLLFGIGMGLWITRLYLYIDSVDRLTLIKKT